MIQNFVFGILFLKILFRAYNIFIFVQTFQWTWPGFYFSFRFSNRKSQSQQKLAKGSHILQYNFTQKISLILRISTQSTWKIMSPQHSHKTFWLFSDKFSNKHVSVWYQKKYLHYTISWRPRTAFLKQFESKYLYMSIYPPKKVFLFRDVVRFYLVGVEWEEVE